MSEISSFTEFGFKGGSVLNLLWPSSVGFAWNPPSTLKTLPWRQLKVHRFWLILIISKKHDFEVNYKYELVRICVWSRFRYIQSEPIGINPFFSGMHSDNFSTIKSIVMTSDDKQFQNWIHIDVEVYLYSRKWNVIN